MSKTPKWNQELGCKTNTGDHVLKFKNSNLTNHCWSFFIRPISICPVFKTVIKSLDFLDKLLFHIIMSCVQCGSTVVSDSMLSSVTSAVPGPTALAGLVIYITYFFLVAQIHFKLKIYNFVFNINHYFLQTTKITDNMYLCH